MIPSNQTKMLQFFSLRYNPFRPDVPASDLVLSQESKNFITRIEDLVLDGGFACITGEPGLGKSTLLRQIHEHMSKIPDINITELARPQSTIIDIYRELANGYGFEVNGFNRFTSFKKLRQNWKKHISTTDFRPIVLIDEAQHLSVSVLDELRIICSESYDSKRLITVVFAGDGRFLEKLGREELRPLASRISVKRSFYPLSPQELVSQVTDLIMRAGNPSLFETCVLESVANAAAGNIRAMVHSLASLLLAAYRSEAPVVNQSIFLRYRDLTGGSYA